MASTALIGLFVQFFVATLFDWLVSSTIPTNGHVWFLYSLAFAQLLLRAIHLCGGGRGAMVAIPLVLSLTAAPLWNAVTNLLPSLSGERYNGLTSSSGEWFLPLGVRVFTYPVFFAIGAVVCPLETLTDLRKRAASVDPPGYCIWLLNAACWTYSVTCTACALPRSNLWNSANPSDWLTRFPAQLEMMAASVISPILLFMLMPDSRVPLLTWAGEATLVPYLLHPFVLKLLRPLLAAGLRTATDGAPPEVLGTAVILETLIVPFALLGGLAAVGKALAALVQRLQKHSRGKPAADAASRSAYDELQPLSDT